MPNFSSIQEREAAERKRKNEKKKKLKEKKKVDPSAIDQLCMFYKVSARLE